MVVVSHLFLFLRKSFRGRFDSCESNLPLFGTIYFPTAPFLIINSYICYIINCIKIPILTEIYGLKIVVLLQNLKRHHGSTIKRNEIRVKNICKKTKIKI